MEKTFDFDLENILHDGLFDQLGSTLIKESEILDENSDGDEFEEMLGECEIDRPQTSVASNVNLEFSRNGDGKSRTCQVELYSKVDETQKSGNSLLRRTISELEKALCDTKALLATRDIENCKVRSHLVSLQGQLEDERTKCRQQEQQLMDKESVIEDLKDQIFQEQNRLYSLETEVPDKPTEYVKRSGVCCAASNDLVQLEKENLRLEEQVKNMKTELISYSNGLIQNSERVNTKDRSQAMHMDTRSTAKCRQLQREKDLQMKLRMKFMRDAFFYFMIDYHAEEQLRAILAILEYEDKRQDLIFESHKMRQKGRKFTISQVSSRKLTFVQEEFK